MKALLSLLFIGFFVAIATGQSITDAAHNSPNVAAPSWTWEIPSLHSVLVTDELTDLIKSAPIEEESKFKKEVHDIPNLPKLDPISEVSDIKKEETEESKNLGAVHEIQGNDVMENFGEEPEAKKHKHDINLKLKLRLKDSHASEEEEDEEEQEGGGSEEEAGGEAEEGESEGDLEKSKKMSKKVKGKFLNPSFTGRPSMRGSFSDPEKPSLQVLYAKLSIAHSMLEGLDNFMMDMQDTNLLEAAKSNTRFAQQLQLINDYSGRLRNLLLAKIDRLNMKIESMKKEAATGSSGFQSRSGRMESTRQGFRGFPSSAGYENRFV